MAKQQEQENARLKNSGRAPKGSKDGLRPESPHNRRPRKPPVRKTIQSNKARFEVCLDSCYTVEKTLNKLGLFAFWLLFDVS